MMQPVLVCVKLQSRVLEDSTQPTLFKRIWFPGRTLELVFEHNADSSGRSQSCAYRWIYDGFSKCSKRFAERRTFNILAAFGSVQCGPERLLPSSVLLCAPKVTHKGFGRTLQRSHEGPSPCSIMFFFSLSSGVLALDWF